MQLSIFLSPTSISNPSAKLCELYPAKYNGLSELLTLALDAGVVQGETFRALAVEAARRVDARGPGTACTVLSCTLVVVWNKAKFYLFIVFLHRNNATDHLLVHTHQCRRSGAG